MNNVRLTCAMKKHMGEKWLLERTRKGLVLLDEDEEVVTSIPTGEANLRIGFPSFWASRRFLVVAGKNGEQFLFEPREKAIDGLRDLVDDCADADPAATAAAFRAKAKRDFLIGGGSFVLGVIITCISFATAAPNGRFVVTTGLLLIGLAEIVRGIYYATRASQHGQADDDDWDDEADDEDEDDDRRRSGRRR